MNIKLYSKVFLSKLFDNITAQIGTGMTSGLWCLGIISAGCVTMGIWPFLDGVQSYPDMIAGGITQGDYYKSKDMITLLLFIVLSMIFGGFGKVSYTMLYKCYPALNKELMHTMLLGISLPALWWIGEGITMMQLPLYRPWETVLFFLIFCVLILFLAVNKSHIRIKDEDIAVNIVYILGGMLFGGLSMLACAMPFVRSMRFHKMFEGWEWQWVGLGAMCLAGIVGILYVLLSRKSMLNKAKWFFLLSQCGLPLYFFLLIPPPLQQGETFIKYPYQTSLLIIVGLLLVVTYGGYVKYCYSRWKHGWKEVYPLFLPSMLAVALLLALPHFPLPVLENDNFHTGEQYLPWHQWIMQGQLPYIGYVPIHGIMNTIMGGINAMLFDGGVATFQAGRLMLHAIVIVVTFLAIRSATTTWIALLIAPFASFADRADRMWFIFPLILLLGGEKIIKQPVKWCTTWLACSIFLLLYTASSGVVFVIGTLPIFLFYSWKVWNEKRKVFWRGALSIFITITLLTSIPMTRMIIVEYLWYVWESVRVNTVAYGIAFEQVIGRVPPPIVGFANTMFSWEILRFSWVGVLLWIAILLLHTFLPTKDKLNIEVRKKYFLVSIALCIFFLAQYSTGRIDPGAFSRTGVLAHYTLTLLFPVLCYFFIKAHIRNIYFVVMIIICTGFTMVMWNRTGVINTIYANISYTIPVPEGEKFRDFRLLGLPNIGRLTLASNAKVIEIESHKKLFDKYLLKGETFMDLRNYSALYYYFDLPVPSPYPATYNAVTTRMQKRVVEGKERTKPPIVFLAPEMIFDNRNDGLIRNYYLVKNLLTDQKYDLQKEQDIVFLLEKSRIQIPLSHLEKMELLKQVYNKSTLDKLPQAWGNSKFFLPLLRKQKIDKIMGTKQGIVLEIHEGKYAGKDSDFLSFTYNCKPVEVNEDRKIRIYFAIAGEEGEQNIEVVIDKHKGRLLVPLGMLPQYLLANQITYIRIQPEFTCTGTIDDIMLYYLPK